VSKFHKFESFFWIFLFLLAWFIQKTQYRTYLWMFWILSWTNLMWACFLGRKGVASILLEAGADINPVNNDGYLSLSVLIIYPSHDFNKKLHIFAKCVPNTICHSFLTNKQKKWNCQKTDFCLKQNVNRINKLLKTQPIYLFCEDKISTTKKILAHIFWVYTHRKSTAFFF